MMHVSEIEAVLTGGGSVDLDERALDRHSACIEHDRARAGRDRDLGSRDVDFLVTDVDDWRLDTRARFTLREEIRIAHDPDALAITVDANAFAFADNADALRV